MDRKKTDCEDIKEYSDTVYRKKRNRAYDNAANIYNNVIDVKALTKPGSDLAAETARDIKCAEKIVKSWTHNNDYILDRENLCFLYCGKDETDDYDWFVMLLWQDFCNVYPGAYFPENLARVEENEGKMFICLNGLSRDVHAAVAGRENLFRYIVSYFRSYTKEGDTIEDVFNTLMDVRPQPGDSWKQKGLVLGIARTAETVLPAMYNHHGKWETENKEEYLDASYVSLLNKILMTLRWKDGRITKGGGNIREDILLGGFPVFYEFDKVDIVDSCGVEEKKNADIFMRVHKDLG